MQRIIGFDPGLVATGWGIITSDGNRLEFVACGVIMPNTKLSLTERLYALYQQAFQLLEKYQPHHVAIEEIFVNKMNPASALKLGNARGILLMLPNIFNIGVTEYGNKTVKKALSATGHADKEQIQKMVLHLLPMAKASITRHDASDALAIAITHAHQTPIANKWNEA